MSDFARRAVWGTMTFLAVATSAYAAVVLLVPGIGAPFVADRRVDMPLALYAHLGGGLIAMAIGPFQLHAGLRRRWLGLHRFMGRTYVIAALASALAALGMARVSMEGIVTHLGFGLLALAWLFTTGMAWLRIRARDQGAHRRWMIRSYALTLAAVMLRLYLPLSMVIGLEFPNAYRVISWLCWVPNLLVAEWIIVRTRVSLPPLVVTPPPALG